MALPHMPTTYTTRKNIYEAAIVRRRTHENDFRNQWDNTASYFNRSGIGATKQTAWESEKSYNNSMTAYSASQEREMKKLTLRKRRLKLEKMFTDEQNQYEAELRGLSGDNYARLSGMKEQVNTIRSAREEERLKLAEEKMYEHFRKNNPDLRDMEQEQHKRQVVEGWQDQKVERQQREEQARRDQEAFERRAEEERRAGLEQERRRAESRLQEEKKVKGQLLDQVDELRARESEAKRLKLEQEGLLRQQWELDQLEEKRKAREQDRKKVEFGRVLLRQHAAHLRRRAKLVQEELEEDRRFLEELLEQEDAQTAVQTARREKVKADATWMKEVIEEQIRVEKTREAELDMLYQDEASRVWQQREAEWARERQARERLMKEVLGARQEQVQDKMEAVRHAQQESLERREELVRELEVAQQLTRRDVERDEAQKTERKAELESQMSERRSRAVAERERAQQELEEEQKGEEDYEEMLRQEAQRMNIGGYAPRPSSRMLQPSSRRQAWM